MRKLNISIIAIASTIMVSCGGGEKNDTTSMNMDTMKTVASKVYTCPMHSEVVADVAGKCPKCGMDLVEKETAPKMEMKSDTIKKGDSSMKMK